ncbi:hypothetical protein RHS01_01255 [Rhizoctonia solani]|uniref:Uncharacterized protein n=1 Tax=Rhizoctonia solani TaxID=456999 RepID=A0A8H7M9Q8_9AGAM|nr:hypothetical protein RHS01_01255 [Rhizoctonia solani]
MSSTQRDDGLLSHISVLNTYTGAPLTLAVPAGAPGHDTHTVHLAVHPSAWSTPPKNDEISHVSAASTTPAAPSSHPAHPIGNPIPTPLLSSLNQHTPTHLPSPASVAKDFVMFHHTNALRVMAGQPMEPWSSPGGIDQASATHWAFMALVAAGQTLPPILLTSYPPHHPDESGLEYTFVTIDGRPYLSLLNPDASPTPTQQHAIQVLTSTLALIPYLDDLTPPPPVHSPLPYTFQPVVPPPRQSTRATLQRVRRLIVALRTLVPLSFTLLRASLFIVFFPQAREPLWLAVIIAVVLYEARLIINRANEALPDIPNRNPDPNDPNPRPAQGPLPNPNGRTNNLLSMNLQSIFDRATLSGIDSEAAQLDLDVPERELRPVAENETPVHEWSVRIRSFVLLLGTTLVPAAWSRRREALRLREGRVRVVYGERANAVRVENEEVSKLQECWVRSGLLFAPWWMATIFNWSVDELVPRVASSGDFTPSRRPDLCLELLVFPQLLETRRPHSSVLLRIDCTSELGGGDPPRSRAPDLRCLGFLSPLRLRVHSDDFVRPPEGPSVYKVRIQFSSSFLVRNKKRDQTTGPAGCQLCARDGLECIGHLAATDNWGAFGSIAKPEHDPRDQDPARRLGRTDSNMITASIRPQIPDDVSMFRGNDSGWPANNPEQHLDAPNWSYEAPVFRQNACLHPPTAVVHNQSSAPLGQQSYTPHTGLPVLPVQQNVSLDTLDVGELPRINSRRVGVAVPVPRPMGPMTPGQAYLFNSLFSLADDPLVLPYTSENIELSRGKGDGQQGSDFTPDLSVDVVVTAWMTRFLFEPSRVILLAQETITRGHFGEKALQRMIFSQHMNGVIEARAQSELTREAAMEAMESCHEVGLIIAA